MKCEKCGNKLENGICKRCGYAIDEDLLVQVAQVSDDFDAEVKIALLGSFKIPAIKRYSGFSAVAKVYCGNSNLGVRIYVLKSDAEKAKEILEAPFDDSELFSEADK